MAAALAAVALLLGIGMFQERLLYFPARSSVAELSAAGLQPWPSAQDFRGLLAEAQGPLRGTAIVFHGNAGHAGHRDYYAAALAPLGLRTILAEYPGYGPRDGSLGEAPFVADAVATIEAAHRAFGPPIVVIGESIGAGVAAAAVGRQPERVAALMLITPFDRLEHVAAYHYPWLPVRRLLRDRYHSVDHLARYAGPKLVVVAGRDDIVPPQFGEALYDALPWPKELLRLPGSGHNDWLLATDAAWWAAAVAKLLPAPAGG